MHVRLMLDALCADIQSDEQAHERDLAKIKLALPFWSLKKTAVAAAVSGVMGLDIAPELAEL